jgi:hypothetical protein
MKSWVSSAFEDPFMSSTASSGRKTTKPKLKAHKSDETVINKSLADNINIKRSNINSDLLLSEKYEPKTRLELMVNKSKVDELSNFLDNSFRKPIPSIFILNGPPGISN